MANTRQEVVNTFDKGMIKDLNPINTPANVLTDCLNGTYITYDGNEFQLQNDRGNISLKYSKLPQGYLPVGTTSYGDILYIVSYNPLENRTQIGTFPSPKLLSNYDNKCETSNVSIMTQAQEDPIKYTEAVDNYQKLVVYFGDKDELIINPGDQYKIGEEHDGQITDIDTTNYSDFEKLEYFIFTENKELINITDLVIPDAQYHYVKWKVPGYFATRWRLPQINENGFSVRTKSITLKDPATATINCQIASDDELIDNLYEKQKLYSIELENAEGTVKDNTSLMEDRIIYDSVNYYNTDIKCKVEVKKDDTGKYIKDYQTFLAPYAKGAGDNGDIKKLLFDQFIQASEAIDLNNTFNPENTHIADEYYNYTVNDNKATVSFNVDCSVVSEGEVGLYIDYVPLKDYINNNYSVDGLFSDSDDRDNVFDGIGQNIIELTLPEEEQVYLLRIEMSDGITDPVYCYKILICSEFMNEFDKEEYPNFEDITMDRWLDYLGEIELVLTNEPTFGEPQRGAIFSEDVVIDDCFWHASEYTVNCFVLPDSEEKQRIDIYRRGYTYTIPNVNIQYKHRQKYLYNFCEAVYSNGRLEFPKAPHANKNITSGIETDASITGNISDDFYVEHQYKDQNEETTQGAVFNFEPACDKRLLLVVELARQERSDYIPPDKAVPLIRYGKEGLTDKTILRTIVWGIHVGEETAEQVVEIPDWVVDPEIVEALACFYTAKNDVDAKRYSAEPLILANVKKPGLVSNAQRTVTSWINSVLETENVACCPGVIKLYHISNNCATGFSSDHFTTYAFIPGSQTGDVDHSCFVFGVFFKTINDEIFFLPYRELGDYATYMHGYNKSSDSEKEDRMACGWDVGLGTPLTWISNKQFLNEEGYWLIYKNVYDDLLTFVNKLRVNTNLAEFTDGFFLNRTLFKEAEKTKLSVEYETKVSINSLHIKETSVSLSSGQSLPNTEELPRLNEMFSADWTGDRGTIISSGMLVSDKEVCSFGNKNAWPYFGSEGESLDDIAEKYMNQNAIIEMQYDNWLNSVEYQNISSGMSIGFYGEAGSDLFTKFTNLLRSTYNSDREIYNGKNVNRLSNVFVDCSKESLDTYWAFCVTNDQQYNPEFDFADYEDCSGMPRYPLMVSKDMRYISVLNLLNEEEEDEIEP